MSLQAIIYSMTAPRGTLKYAKEAVQALDTHNNMRLEAMRDMMAHARTKAAFIELAERFINYLNFLTTNAKDYNVQQATRAVSELNCNVWLPLECGQATKESTIAAARAVFPAIADDLCDYTFESLQTRVADWINVMHWVLDHAPAPLPPATPRRATVEEAHDEASAINDEIDNIISYAQGRRPIQQNGDVNWVFETAVRVWRETRNAACRYEDAFIAFHQVTDCDTFTDVCRAWLAAMDEAHAMNEAWHLEQPCSAARNNAHYYKLLVAKRQRKGQVVMTTIAGAYEYIVNDAVAGDMVKSVDLYHREVLMRDGSWLQLVEASHMPHGFYVKTQDKLA